MPRLVASLGNFSTAAVCGKATDGLCDEAQDPRSVNPYGRSKLLSEFILNDVCAASPMRCVILRNFNVAGADPDGEIGQRGRVSTHLTKFACEAAVGIRDFVPVYGTDYPTPDGTCIRDFVHVRDLADAHLAAVDYLSAGGASQTLNCGYGRGYSVREVINAVQSAAGQQIKVREMGRRPGDPPVLVARCDRIRNVLEWRPKFDDIGVIAGSALAWEKKIASEAGHVS